MEQYIPKSTVMAEIDSLLDKGKYHEEYDCAYRDGNNGALYALKDKLNTFGTKEIDLKKEIDDFMAKEWEGVEEKDEPLYSMIKNDLTDVAKHFIELGMQINNKA